MARLGEIITAKGQTMPQISDTRVNGQTSPLMPPPLPSKYYTKRCKQCGEEKEIHSFQKTPHGNSRFETCIECFQVKRCATMRARRAERARLASVFTCLNCNVEKPLEESSARNKWCRPCQQVYQREIRNKKAASMQKQAARVELPTVKLAREDAPAPTLWERFRSWITGTPRTMEAK